MNPLSPFTYYRRHKSQALVLIGTLTLGVYAVVSLTVLVFETMRHSTHSWVEFFGQLANGLCCGFEEQLQERVTSATQLSILTL